MKFVIVVGPKGLRSPIDVNKVVGDFGSVPEAELYLTQQGWQPHGYWRWDKHPLPDIIFWKKGELRAHACEKQSV